MALECSIDVLNLSARCSNALKAENIILVRDLIKLTPAEIKKIVNIGEKQVSEIQNEVSRVGLALGCSVQPVKQEEDSHLDIDTEADYVLEAYWWSHKLVNNVSRRHKKFVLAYITAYRDYEDDESELLQLTEMLQLKDKLVSVYGSHPDGEVVVELTIRQEFVNA
jgi:proteasome lid subunit RPN8/RPN11